MLYLTFKNVGSKILEIVQVIKVGFCLTKVVYK